MKRTSLQVVTDILKDQGAVTCSVIEYIPKQDEYAGMKIPLVMPVSELQQYVEAKKLADDTELGICSQFVNNRGVKLHLVFADYISDGLGKILSHKDILVRSSSSGQHVYRNEARRSIAEVASHLLLLKGSQLDLKWLAAGLNQGFNILRFTANTPRFKNSGVPIEL